MTFLESIIELKSQGILLTENLERDRHLQGRMGDNYLLTWGLIELQIHLYSLFQFPFYSLAKVWRVSPTFTITPMVVFLYFYFWVQIVLFCASCLGDFATYCSNPEQLKCIEHLLQSPQLSYVSLLLDFPEFNHPYSLTSVVPGSIQFCVVGEKELGHRTTFIVFRKHICSIIQTLLFCTNMTLFFSK